MSAENVETLRRYHELLNDTGEPPVEIFHPEVEIHMFRGSPISGPYRRHDGLQRWCRDTFDVMVALERFVGRMKHTDLAANFPPAVIVRFREGLIVRFEGYRERSEALEAAGLGSK
jgi:hypothetical protein